MKKVFAWIGRIICLVLIAAAIFTFVNCLMHINDDHSVEAILAAQGDTQQTMLEDTQNVVTEPQVLEAEAVSESAMPEMPEHDESLEEPTLTLSPDGNITVNHPYSTVTAAFSSIVNNITADLKWLVDGEVVHEETGRILVEGSTLSYDVELDVESYEAESVPVILEVAFAGKSVSVEIEVPVELPQEDAVVIRTAEIPVTALEDTNIYEDSDLIDKLDGQLAEDDVALLLEYATNDDGIKVLRLQTADGDKVWVDAKQMEISEEDCTNDEDYAEEDKVEFVNSMGYDSPTEMLVWVSLYTQKVNVFTGYKGNWELEEVFDCASGKNQSPTTTGTYYYNTLVERWDLGETYCEPVLVYNGGEAFTSQPYDVETEEISDDTMGEPVSGGAIRLLEEDIAWMEENLQMNTMIVVY